MDAFIERNVVSVKPAGRAVVYDIQVEGTELFYADGYVVHNTRWQSEDIIGRMEALHKGNPKALFGPVEIINLPAQAKDDDPIGRRPGEWLWEEFYGAQHYESLRLTMPAGEWSALYMGEPLDKFGEHVAEDDFMRYDAYPKPDDTQKVIISVDTAQKATKRSNPTAITVYKRGVDKVHYLVYACKVKSKMEQVIKLLSRLATIWGANYILIEDAGFGSQILQNYQGKLPAPLVEFSPHSKNSKEFQFENAVPYITTGAVRFPKQAPWLSGFINELVAFPSGSEDDYCDSFSQYISHEVRTFRGGTKSMKVVG